MAFLDTRRQSPGQYSCPRSHRRQIVNDSLQYAQLNSRWSGTSSRAPTCCQGPHLERGCVRRRVLARHGRPGDPPPGLRPIAAPSLRRSRPSRPHEVSGARSSGCGSSGSEWPMTDAWQLLLDGLEQRAPVDDDRVRDTHNAIAGPGGLVERLGAKHHVGSSGEELPQAIGVECAHVLRHGDSGEVELASSRRAKNEVLRWRRPREPRAPRPSVGRNEAHQAVADALPHRFEG
jgi:hypothetical protein